MPVRVTFVITHLTIGGAEIMLLELLSHLDRSRFQPTVVSLIGMAEVGPRIAELGIPVHTLGMRPGVPSPVLFWRLVRLLKQLKPDVVSTWMYHADLLGGVAARLADCPNVIWGLHHSDLSRTGVKRSTRLVIQSCALLSGMVPARIISCSIRAKEVHEAAGYRAGKIQVIPNGLDLSRFAPDPSARASVREELGLAPSTPLVGLVARFDPLKNHVGFIEAAVKVLRQIPEAHFLLAGTGVDAENEILQSAIARYAVEDHFHLLGRRDDVPRLMAALDVLASASFGEAFPIVLGEAMACCIPCVVTDVGDSAEIVADTGRTIAPCDMDGLARELVAVLRLPAAERAALGERARARVAANYEIGHVARLYQAVFDEVATGDRSRNARCAA